jgi:hypothetical protein
MLVKMTIDKMSEYKMSAGRIIVDKMTVDMMNIDKMSCCQFFPNAGSLILVRQSIYVHVYSCLSV